MPPSLRCSGMKYQPGSGCAEQAEANTADEPSVKTDGQLHDRPSKQDTQSAHRTRAISMKDDTAPNTFEDLQFVETATGIDFDVAPEGLRHRVQVVNPPPLEIIRSFPAPAQPDPSITARPGLLTRCNPFAWAYREELDAVLEDTQMVLDDPPIHLTVCTTVAKVPGIQGPSDDYSQLRVQWSQFIDEAVATWNWYAKVQASFVAFLFAAMQTTAENDVVTNSVAYVSLAAIFLALGTNQLLVRHLDTSRCRSLHYALHFKEQRAENRYKYWPSIENLFSVATWTHLWCGLLTALAFFWTFLQTTNDGVLLWEKNTVLVAWIARILTAVLALYALVSLELIHGELQLCWKRLKNCDVVEEVIEPVA
uniref:Transmembrane protein n=1 Tax=Mycena chlorophos TaxID=658473 RepID=A0ABQ0LKJ1_MYCCL|nr:predicted protein [Mycena chlorophos]